MPGEEPAVNAEVVSKRPTLMQLSGYLSGETAWSQVTPLSLTEHILKRKPAFSPSSRSCPDLQSLHHESEDGDTTSVREGEHPSSHLAKKMQRVHSPNAPSSFTPEYYNLISPDSPSFGASSFSPRPTSSSGVQAGFFGNQVTPPLTPHQTTSLTQRASIPLRSSFGAPALQHHVARRNLVPRVAPLLREVEGINGVFPIRSASPRLSLVPEARMDLCAGTEWPFASRALVETAKAGLASGQALVPAEDCVNGVYYLPAPAGSTSFSRFCGIFKPTDEENEVDGATMKSGLKGGDGAVRECIAYLVDSRKSSPHSAGVPATAMVLATVATGAGNGQATSKLGSVQMYVHHECSAEDLGPALFTTEDVHRIAMLDLRLCNQDRHVGNILVQRVEKDGILGTRSTSVSMDEGDTSVNRAPRTRHSRSVSMGSYPDASLRLVPIDHGFSLPHPLSMGETDFSWLSWAQAKTPLTASARAWVGGLDCDADIAYLEKVLGPCNMLPSAEYLLTLRIGTALLKKGTAAGLTLYQIGSLMTREMPDSMCALEEAVHACVLALGGEAALKHHSSFMGILGHKLDDMISKAAYLDEEDRNFRSVKRAISE